MHIHTQKPPHSSRVKLMTTRAQETPSQTPPAAGKAGDVPLVTYPPSNNSLSLLCLPYVCVWWARVVVSFFLPETLSAPLLRMPMSSRASHTALESFSYTEKIRSTYRTVTTYHIGFVSMLDSTERE